MGKKRSISFITAAAMLLIVALAGCGNPEAPAGPGSTAEVSGAPSAAEASSAEVKGEITFFHHKTDIDGNLMQDYIKVFNKKYPEVKVKTEAVSDYENQLQIRMNSDQYGDVLMVTSRIPLADVPNYYLKLGSAAELSKKYNWINISKKIGDDLYGIPIAGNASGVVYNKKVFEAAGVTELPDSSEEFLAALQAVKDKTDAIPLYTNYAADWPLPAWEYNMESIAGDPDARNELAHIDDPFAPGKPHYVLYKVMYDVVKQELIEEDPLTTDWENSKTMMAQGKIATMVLGSWAVPQVQALAENAEDISFMAFPNNKDGTVYCSSGPDYNVGINKNTKYPEAARAWLDFFVDESGYATDAGCIPPMLGAELPSGLKGISEQNAELLVNNPAPDEEATWVSDIDNLSEVGLEKSDFKKRIVEAALGTRKESYDDIMMDLNDRWAKARKELTDQGKIK